MAANNLTSQLQGRYIHKLNLAKRVTAIGMLVSALLASSKLIVGWLAHSTAVFADGLENMGDLFGSGLVLYALFVASRPPDKEHPTDMAVRRRLRGWPLDSCSLHLESSFAMCQFGDCGPQPRLRICSPSGRWWLPSS